MKWRTSLGAATQRLVRVEAPTDVAEARRQGADVAARIGLGEQTAGRLALAITEASSNMVKHAREGVLLLRPLSDGDDAGVEVLALDKGPGIADVSRSMQDGYSTAGTPGTGLGALGRLTHSLEIFSRRGLGTAVRFIVTERTEPANAADGGNLGAVCVAKPGESVCGDAWAVLDDERHATLLLVDGLGHGPDAARAAKAALGALGRNPAPDSALGALGEVHRELRGTRGAAGAVALLDYARGRGRFCGIGNVSCVLATRADARQLVSHNGILGHLTRTMREFEFDFPPGATLIAHSDGLDTRWRLGDYPGIERHHPALVAGLLYRDHVRGRDDATCVALRRPTERRP